MAIERNVSKTVFNGEKISWKKCSKISSDEQFYLQVEIMSIAIANSNIKDMETKISSLERANFDLKLRLHYLNKKYVNNEGNEFDDGYENGQGDIATLREENEYSKRRIVDLESELLQLQLLRDREASEFQKALKLKSPDIIQFEENRKREREVAQAIAEHDAALIAKLQEEVTNYQESTLQDKAVINTMNGEIAHLRSMLDEKEKQLNDYKERNKYLTTKNEELEDKVRRLENGDSLLVPFNGASTGGQLKGGNTSQTPMLFSANTNGQQTSILINSSNFTAATQLLPNQQQSSASTNLQNPPPSTFLLSTQGVNAPAGSAGHPNSMLPGPESTQMVPAAATDANVGLYQENRVLKDRLQKLQESIANQEMIIKSMKDSAHEFNMIENDEIKRLEQELDRCLDEKEKLRQKYQKLELEYEVTNQQLQQYRRFYGATDNLPLHLTNGGLHSHRPNVFVDHLQFEKTIEMYK